MPEISVVIITYNEERYIEQCIKSVSRLADEIIVIDSYSTDKTAEICKSLGARFIEHSFTGYRDQKNFASTQATYDYILSLDADEALSAESVKSILTEKKDFRFDAYKFNRFNCLCGQWISHTDWYPDRKIRLFNRKKGEWGGANIHEKVKMQANSKVGFIKGDILHWRYDSIEQMVNVMNRYSTLSAEEYFRQGVKPGMIKIVFSPLWHFFRSYFIRRGFMDGYNGFFISISEAKISQLKYMKLRQLYINSKSEKLDSAKAPAALANSGMRIGLDAKRAFYNQSGLGNYSRNLINALTKIERDNTFFLFTPKTGNRIYLSDATERNVNIISPGNPFHKLMGSLWRSKFMSNDIKKNRIDVYHGLSHELPFGLKDSGIKTVVTIHDLIFLRFPDFYNPVNVFIYRKKMEYACKIADRVIAISSQTKEDLITFLNVDPGKIDIIPQSCNQVFQRKISGDEYQKIKIKYDLPENYILYVGTIEERKNLLNILKGVIKKQIEIPIVVIGRKTGYYNSIIKPFLNENRNLKIQFPENVHNDELPAFYQNSICFVYPSFFEGFGIPILEAITSGTPVITSKGSCFEETGGPGSIYINPRDPDEIGDAIKQISENNELRSRMILLGFEHAKQFLPEKIAIRYLDLYKRLI